MCLIKWFDFKKLSLCTEFAWSSTEYYTFCFMRYISFWRNRHFTMPCKIILDRYAASVSGRVGRPRGPRAWVPVGFIILITDVTLHLEAPFPAQFKVLHFSQVHFFPNLKICVSFLCKMIWWAFRGIITVSPGLGASGLTSLLNTKTHLGQRGRKIVSYI